MVERGRVAVPALCSHVLDAFLVQAINDDRVAVRFHDMKNVVEDECCFVAHQSSYGQRPSRREFPQFQRRMVARILRSYV